MLPPDPLPLPAHLDEADRLLERRLIEAGPPPVPAGLEARLSASLAASLAASPATSLGPDRQRPAAPRARPALRLAGWLGAAGLAAAAGFAIAVSLRPAGPAPVTAPDPGTQVARAAAPVPVFENGAPVGYRLRSETPVYQMDTPMGVVDPGDGPRRAMLRDSLVHQTWEHPESHATLEMETPQRQVVLVEIHVD